MPKSILAAIDLAASTDQILAATQDYAAAFSAKVYLVHVAEVGPTLGDHVAMDLSLDADTISGPELPIAVDREEEALRLRGKHRALQDLKARLSDAGIDATALLIEGATVEKLLLEIDRLEIDLVIIGSHAPSFLQDFLFGSTTKEVLRDAGCPVVVLPPKWDDKGPT